MTEKQFANGITVKAIETKYGQLIKLGINKDSILNNPYNERGWVNIVLKTGKSGNMYAEIDNFVPNSNFSSGSENTASSDNLVEFGEMEAPEVEALVSEEEIPFYERIIKKGVAQNCATPFLFRNLNKLTFF